MSDFDDLCPPPTNDRIRACAMLIGMLEEEIELIESTCEHDDVVLSRFDDREYYLQPNVTYYQTHRCRKCRRIETVDREYYLQPNVTYYQTHRCRKCGRIETVTI